jgi:hypothetical protein
VGGHQERRAAYPCGEQLRGLITVDRNLSFQQNLPKFNIAGLVLHATSNRLADLMPLVPQILSTLPTLTTGNTEHIGI